MKKQKIPGIFDSKGLSVDYWNEILGRIFALDKGEIYLKETFEKYGKIKNYEEYFSKENNFGKRDHFEKNKDKIIKINQLVIILNSYQEGKISVNEFKQFAMKLNALIYGQKLLKITSND